MGKKTLIVENIGIKFNLGQQGRGTYQDFLARIFRRGAREEDEFWALKDINFSLEKGDRLGNLRHWWEAQVRERARF